MKSIGNNSKRYVAATQSGTDDTDSDSETSAQTDIVSPAKLQQQQSNWRVLAWRDSAEFAEFAAHLSAAVRTDSTESLRAVRDRVAVWTARVEQQRLPRSVLATGELASALLLRECHSMANAVQRFVSLVTGEEETRERNTRFVVPVTQVADRISIPEWLVRIRHDVCHGMLPPTGALTDACYQALEWLTEYFWLPQAAKQQSATGHMTTTSLASIRRFIRLQLRPRGETASAELNAHLDALKERRMRTASADNRRWLHALVTSGLLVRFPRSNSTHAPTADPIETAVAFWLPLLGVLKKCSLVPALIEGTLEAAADGAVESKLAEGLQMWSLGWLAALNRVAFPDGSRRPPLAYCVNRDTREMVDWPRLLRRYCVSALCPRLLPLARQIVHLHLPQLPVALTDGLTQILDEVEKSPLSAQLVVKPPSSSKPAAYSKKRRRQENRQGIEEASVMDSSSSSSGSWRRDFITDWSAIPIGCCPTSSQ